MEEAKIDVAVPGGGTRLLCWRPVIAHLLTVDAATFPPAVAVVVSEHPPANDLFGVLHLEGLCPRKGSDLQRLSGLCR